MRLFPILLLLLAATALRAQTSPAMDSVARIVQSPATPAAGYTRFNFPRRDLTVRIGDLTVSPALALTGWAGFAGDPADGELMGDLVTSGTELKDVLAEFSRQGIDVMAIHNHLAGETPAVTYVHYHAHGSATALAVKIDRVIARTAAPRPVTAAPAAAPTIDSGLVFRTLGVSGRANGAIASVAVMLVPGAVTMDGRTLVPGLAYATPIAVQMVDASRAVATGDFTVPGDKVQPVLTALAAGGISATAVHTHLIGETPKLYYIHFWADGALDSVLRGLRGAIDAAR